MPRYRIDVQEIAYVSYEVEAADADEARRLYLAGRVTEPLPGVQLTESDIVDVKEAACSYFPMLCREEKR